MIGFLRRFFQKSNLVRPYCSAILAAAGNASRMGGENKLLMPLGDKPVLAHTLLALDSTEEIDEIVIAAREDELLPFADLCKTYGIQKPVKVIVGGKTRTESVLLAAQAASSKATLLAVHDGARPLVTPELIAGVIQKARTCAAAAPAIPLHDTVKAAHDGVVQYTPDRSTLFAVQTPQVFDADLLRSALQSAVEQNAPITDDCSAVERIGKAVYLTEGSEENIKITTPIDLVIAESILHSRADA